MSTRTAPAPPAIRTARPTLHLLMLATRVPARPGDGTPGFVLDLARAVAGPCDVTVLAPRVRGAPEELEVDGVRVRRFPYFPRPLEGLAEEAILPRLRAHPWRAVEVPFLLLGFLLATARAVRRHPPDLINAHWILPAGLIALIVGRLWRVPYLLTVHGGDAYALTGSLLDRIKDTVVRRAAAVAPVSGDIARNLAPTVGPGTVIPMGVPVEDIASAAGPRRPVPDRFLFVGRLAGKKGVHVALRALHRVPGARLRVVGDGPERGRLEALAAEVGVTDRVEFVGKLANREVLGELSRARALLIPSVVAPDGDRDGTPVVLGEAVAAGTPVVASALGGLAEHIDDEVTGLLVSPDDPAALARAVHRVLEEPGLAEALARRARGRMRGGALDLTTTGERYVRLMTGIAAPEGEHALV